MGYVRKIGGQCVRINSFDLLEKEFRLSLNDGTIICNGERISPESIGAVWFRKFGFFRRSRQALLQQEFLRTSEQSYLATEFARIIEVFESLFERAFWLTCPARINLNKFLVLGMASRIGFEVPPTYLVNDLQDLKRDLKEGKSFISKSIYNPLIMKIGESPYSMYTTRITEDDLERLPEFFLPSMVQKMVEKQFEIRVFYLMGECYSMAILSQEDNQTSMDYRRYNYDKPNRFVPYRLPKDIIEKIDILMEELHLNTGSLDFIKDQDGRYVFLEVNPTGQFGMVDFSCNYGLHKKIAEILMKEDKIRAI